MLLAYGKKHISLLRSLVADRGSVVPLHTILEVFRCALEGAACRSRRLLCWRRGAAAEC